MRTAPTAGCMEDLFAAMYRHHPVRVPIAGTVESIQAITPEILQSCYDAFYHPANMMLCVVGDVDPEQVISMAERILPWSAARFPQRDYGPAGSARLHHAPAPAGRWMWPCPPSSWASPAHGLASPPQARRAAGGGEVAGGGAQGESPPGCTWSCIRRGSSTHPLPPGMRTCLALPLLSCGGDSRNPEAVRDAICAEARRLGTQGVEGRTCSAG